jgi:hypothetical protein
MRLHEIIDYPAAETADQLLIDVARRIQLSPEKHAKAETAYHALCDHIDREDSPLHGLVGDCYPSGSFGIGAVVASRVRTNQHDLDVVLELHMHRNTAPAVLLGMLYNAVRGEKGSRYYDKTTLNSRCVTVEYADGFKVDMMPIVRDSSGIERQGELFHSKDGESYRKPVNPYGFKTLYNEMVQTDPTFVRKFRTRDGLILLEKAYVEPMEGQVRLDDKSPRTVAVQLLKRYRDVRHRLPGRKDRRCVPSVVIAAWALDKPTVQPTLLHELMDLSRFIQRRILTAQRHGQLVDVYNPAWPGVDRFTDRWPGTAENQDLLLGDLEELSIKLEALASDAFSPSQTKALLQDLFGETAAEDAITKMMERRQSQEESGGLKYGLTGSVVTGTSAAVAGRAAARSRTDFGGDA